MHGSVLSRNLPELQGNETVTNYNISPTPWQQAGAEGGDEEVRLRQQYSDMADHTALVVFPFIMFLGLFGNSAAFVVLQSRYYRGTSTGFLLSALAVLDTLNLVTGLLRRWIGYLTDWNTDIRSFSQSSCLIHTYLTYCAHTASPWTLMIFTVERTVAVYYPVGVRQMCSLKRVVIMWVVSHVIISVFYSQVFVLVLLQPATVNVSLSAVGDNVIVSPVPWLCDTDPQRQQHKTIFDWLDTLLAFFLPWLVMAVGNVLIICRLKRPPPGLVSAGRQRASQRAVTGMLLAVNIVFLVCTGPVFLYFATDHYLPQDTALQRAQMVFGPLVLLILYYTNNAVNFILYCVSARRFREAFAAVLCRLDVNFTVTRAVASVRATVTATPSIGTETPPTPRVRPVIPRLSVTPTPSLLSDTLSLSVTPTPSIATDTSRLTVPPSPGVNPGATDTSRMTVPPSPGVTDTSRLTVPPSPDVHPGVTDTSGMTVPPSSGISMSTEPIWSDGVRAQEVILQCTKL